jgi:hypothetical protein
MSHGFACGKDGCHVLTKEAAEALWAEAQAAKAKRAAEMPDDQTAIRVMSNAHSRLMELGWRDATYAPADGSDLELIEVGSTGIHLGYRDTDRCFWIVDDDVWPSRPVLWRAVQPQSERGEQ